MAITKKAVLSFWLLMLFALSPGTVHLSISGNSDPMRKHHIDLIPDSVRAEEVRVSDASDCILIIHPFCRHDSDCGDPCFEREQRLRRLHLHPGEV
jgi:hypothetical protein